MPINPQNIVWDKPTINPANIEWDKPAKPAVTPNYNAESEMMSQPGTGEGLLSAGTGLLAAPVAGVGALISRPFRSLYAGKEENPISSTFEEISNALTYKPKSKIGQNVADTLGEVASWPMRKASEGWGLILDEAGKALPSELPEVPYLRPIVGTIAEASAMGALGGKKAVADRVAQAKNAVSLKGVNDVLTPIETPPVAPVQSTAWQRRQAAEQQVREMKAKAPKPENIVWEPDPITATDAGELQTGQTALERQKAIDRANIAGVDEQFRESAGINPDNVVWQLDKKNRVSAYDPIIEQAAATHGVDSSLIKAVIDAESRGKKGAVSPKGAQGLMQIMPPTAADLGLKPGDVFIPEKNIDAGTRYLRQLLNRYGGDETKALAAYNWGMGNVDKLIKAGKFDIANLPKETQNYINRIMKNREKPTKSGEPQSTETVTEPVSDSKNPQIKNDVESGVKTEPPPVVEPETISRPKVSEQIPGEVGQAPAGIAKRIEAAAIEQGLIKDGFDKLSTFDRVTMKDQADRAAKVINGDIEQARRMIRGEEPLPEGLRGISLYKAMSEYMTKTKDAELAHELANSPLSTEVSLAAQELSLTRGLLPDSFAAKVAEVKRARETAAKVDGKKVMDIKNGLKKKMQEVHLPKEELNWNKFLSQIQC